MKHITKPKRGIPAAIKVAYPDIFMRTPNTTPEATQEVSHG